METIRIDFVDFWQGFDKSDNYFFNLLSKRFELVISDEPDLIFYSCYGKEYLKFDCIRVFYSAENMRPDFTGCDYAMTFDHIERKNHYRLPLYGLYIDHFYNGSKGKSQKELTTVRSREKLEEIWKRKTKFCCMVVSNANSKKRLDFFRRLSLVKHVDSGGKTLNNVGGPVDDKIAFINDYKFVIAFENQSYPGYTTEKIIEPFFTDSIPIYWGNSEVYKDFNKKRFLNYTDYKTEDDLIDRILEIDNDNMLAIEILSEPVFPKNKIPHFIDENEVIQFLTKIIFEKDGITPVARTSKKYFHFLKRKSFTLFHLMKAKLRFTKR